MHIQRRNLKGLSRKGRPSEESGADAMVLLKKRHLPTPKAFVIREDVYQRKTH